MNENKKKLSAFAVIAIITWIVGAVYLIINLVSFSSTVSYYVEYGYEKSEVLKSLWMTGLVPFLAQTLGFFVIPGFILLGISKVLDKFEGKSTLAEKVIAAEIDVLPAVKEAGKVKADIAEEINETKGEIKANVKAVTKKAKKAVKEAKEDIEELKEDIKEEIEETKEEIKEKLDK